MIYEAVVRISKWDIQQNDNSLSENYTAVSASYIDMCVLITWREHFCDKRQILWCTWQPLILLSSNNFMKNLDEYKENITEHTPGGYSTIILADENDHCSDIEWN